MRYRSVKLQYNHVGTFLNSRINYQITNCEKSMGFIFKEKMIKFILTCGDFDQEIDRTSLILRIQPRN